MTVPPGSAAPRRNVLITGAANGIGRAYAQRFAAGGSRLILADITSLDETLALIPDADVRAVHCDVSSEESVRALGQEAESFGGVDVLVHNAGIFPFEPMAEMTLAGWRRVMSVNVDSLFLLTKAFLGHMTEAGWGRIIATSSGMFVAGVPGAAHYVASKGAVIGFVRGLAGEVGAAGVTVNAVAPGLIRTPGTESSPDAGEGQFAMMRQIQPIKRTGLPSDLVGIVAFLASDDAGFITGQTVLVDGGVAHL